MSQNVLIATPGEGFEKRMTEKEKLINEFFMKLKP